MMNTRKKLFITLLSLSLICTAIFLVLHFRDKPSDYAEYFCGYDDCISFIVEGYQAHWDGFSPEDLDLSYIYRYESPCGGFEKYDIDGDGTEELLLGDQFENGDYEIYDIFTFNKKNGNIIHLFCGGERDRCTLNGSGVIIETGSNSAEDSFTQCYVLKNLKLKKLGKDEPVTLDLLTLQFDRFINYAKPEQLCGGYTELRYHIPAAAGRTSHFGNQGRKRRPQKSKAHTDVAKACEGQGILTLKEPGGQAALSLPDENAGIIGTMIHEEGFIPETYRCLGYIKGWFLVEVEGKVGFRRRQPCRMVVPKCPGSQGTRSRCSMASQEVVSPPLLRRIRHDFTSLRADRQVVLYRRPSRNSFRRLQDDVQHGEAVRHSGVLQFRHRQARCLRSARRRR